MKRAPFKHWIVWTGACCCPPGALRSTASNITFVAFLDEVVATEPTQRKVHVILENFATHETDLVKTFLERHR